MLVSRLGGLSGLNVADLFAGSGALGLEALSRGAAAATFVERDRTALAALQANVASLGAQDRAVAMAVSAQHVPSRGSAFDLLLLDPPYDMADGAAALLEQLQAKGWIGPDSMVAYESGVDVPEWGSALTVIADRKVGKARLTLLRPVGAG